MNTLDFFHRVLPQTGWYVVTIIGSDGPRQRYFQTVEELERAVLTLDEAGHNTYMAVNSFKEKGNRRQDNVAACRSLYLDVDCGEGKPYPDQKAGLAALREFIKATNLPIPMVVSSGRGLHIYWPFEKDVSPDEWQPLADALKRRTVELSFEVDPVATADSARILRPVGTFNPKNGAIVEVVVPNHATTFDTLRLLLAPSAALNRMHVPLVRKTTLLDNLAVKPEFPPGNGVVIESKCQQINWVSSHQPEVSEPLWYATLGVAAFCDEAELTAIRWSNQHPDFNQVRTITKMQQWQRASGPSLCSKFNELNPAGCKGCVFKDRIKTPVQLGMQYAEAPPPEDAPVETMIPMPFPFKRTEAGIKITVNEVDLDVCKFDVLPVSYGHDEGLGYEVVRYVWKRPHVGWRELKMRQAYLTDGHRDFATVIADQGIVLYNRKQTEHFQLMLRSYMEELRKQQTMTNLHASMGWKEANTQFILGDKIFRREEDGSVTEHDINMSARTSRVSEDLYGSKGTLQDWVNFTKVLDTLKLDGHKFALGVSLSSVLYQFTGLKGITISLFGQTGSGKTLAQLWQQSVWGDPTRLHFTAKFTPNALFSRMALHNNLPFTIDEATMFDSKDIGDFLYWVTQGRDKARLSRSAEERDARTWATPVTLSTNRSLASMMYTKALDTDAQNARLLELTFPSSSVFTKSPDIGRKIYHAITENYGTVGPVFIKHLLGMGEAQIKAKISEAIAGFAAKYDMRFAGHERFWETAIVLQDMALEMAQGLGLVAFDHKSATEFALSQLSTTRVATTIGRTDAFDVIANYVNDCGRSTVEVMHTGTSRLMNHARMPSGDVRVRYDVHRLTPRDPFDHGTLTFDRVHFREWLADRNGDYKAFVDELTFENAIATPKSQKALMGRDTPFRLPQTYVVAFNLNHPRLKHLLENVDMNIENALLGQLQLVTP